MPPGNDYNYSVWLKGEIGGERVKIAYSPSTPWTYLTLTTEWKRYSANVVNSDINFRIYKDTGAPTFYAYGAQATQTSYLAPYIKTTNAPVTRAQDNTSIPMSGNLPAAGKPFTIVCDSIIPYQDSLSGYRTVMKADVTSNYFWLRRSDPNLVIYIGSDLLDLGGIDENPHRLTVSFDGFTATTYVDGVEIQSKTMANVISFDSTGSFYIGGYDSSTGSSNGYIKNFKIYSKALTDDQVAALGGPE